MAGREREWRPERHFVYERMPRVFLGRKGEGALEIVWDTNILIDYLDHGASLWAGHDLPADAQEPEQVAALGQLIDLWMLRDIRIRILDETIDDAKRRLTQERREARVIALTEMTAALALDDCDTAPPEGSQRRVLSGAAAAEREYLRGVLSTVPVGMDRELVASSIQLGAHVFLTRDRGVLACADRLRQFALHVSTPLDLLVELTATGEVVSLSDPSSVPWPIPDLQRMSHLIQILRDGCLLYTSPSPRDGLLSRMPSSA